MVRASELIVEVRNVNLQRVGLIHPDDLDLELNVQHNGLGSWTLTLPREHHLAPDLNTPGSGIIVSDSNGVLGSGPTYSPEQQKSAGNLGGTVTFEGVLDNLVLSDMLAWPQPSNPDVTTQTASYDERTGPAETLMHQYVAANVGPDAPAARRNLALVMGEDQGRGKVVTKSARFPKLGELCEELATPSDLGFRVVQRGGELVFETYAVEDKSGLVRLTMENTSLSGERVTLNPPTATRVIVAGSGRYVQRTFYQYETDESVESELEWGRRIERFLDQRQTVKKAEYDAAAAAMLAEEGLTGISVQAVPSDDSPFVYGVDWQVGDRVTVEVNGVESTALVTGLVLTASGDGLKYGAVIGDPAAFSREAAQIQRVNDIATRLSNLERAGDAGRRTGEITLWPTSVALPIDALECNGALVSRTTYANLFAILGTTEGAGDGSTTFQLPTIAAVGSARYVIFT